jgi:hypothetical protein
MTEKQPKQNQSEKHVTCDTNRRHWLVAILLQIGIRLRFAYETCFGLKPLLSPLTAYPSKWRPKNCPKYDFITQTGFIFVWLVAAIGREFGILYAIMCKCGFVSYVMNPFHDWLSNRLIR